MSSRIANPVSKLARSIGSVARPRSQVVDGPTMPKYVELLRNHSTEQTMTQSQSRPMTTRHEPSPVEPFPMMLPSQGHTHQAQRRTPVPIMFNPHTTQTGIPSIKGSPPDHTPEVVYVAKNGRDQEPKWSDIEKISVDPVNGS